jgi:hypothetical protein
MDFFASLPPQEAPPRPVRQRSPVWTRPSPNVLPAPIPGDSLLIHSPAAAVSIDGLRVYPNALAFTLHVLYRGGRDLRVRRPGGPSPFRIAGLPRDDPASANRDLRLGVLYADGRRAIPEFRTPHTPRGREPEAPVMRTLSGHGSEDEWAQGFYIWGLPAEGPITLVYQWLDQEAPETRHEIDGDAVRAAADRIVVLWDDDEEDEDADGSNGSDAKAQADRPE